MYPNTTRFPVIQCLPSTRVASLPPKKEKPNQSLLLCPLSCPPLHHILVAVVVLGAVVCHIVYTFLPKQLYL